MEAVWKIEVEDFPAFIVVDDKGNDFFAEVTAPSTSPPSADLIVLAPDFGARAPKSGASSKTLLRGAKDAGGVGPALVIEPVSQGAVQGRAPAPGLAVLPRRAGGPQPAARGGHAGERGRRRCRARRQDGDGGPAMLRCPGRRRPVTPAPHLSGGEPGARLTRPGADLGDPDQGARAVRAHDRDGPSAIRGGAVAGWPPPFWPQHSARVLARDGAGHPRAGGGGRCRDGSRRWRRSAGRCPRVGHRLRSARAGGAPRAERSLPPAQHGPAREDGARGRVSGSDVGHVGESGPVPSGFETTTGRYRSVNVPSPSWPQPPWPQHRAWPLVSTAQACRVPTLISLAPVRGPDPEGAPAPGRCGSGRSVADGTELVAAPASDLSTSGAVAAVRLGVAAPTGPRPRR